MNKQLLQKAKPIPFNTKMVKAILDERKTQTRIPVKIKNKLTRDWALSTGVEWLKVNLKDEKYPYSIREQNGAWNEYSLKDFINKYSQYKVGDVLYARETFVLEGMTYDKNGEIIHHKEPIIHYKADEKKLNWVDEWENECNIPWKPSTHMPKKYARIFLKVTNVRVERLQDMSYKDLRKEGIWHKSYISNKTVSFQRWNTWKNLWNSTVKDGYKWEDNPFVFVYEFEKVEVC